MPDRPYKPRLKDGKLTPTGQWMMDLMAGKERLGSDIGTASSTAVKLEKEGYTIHKRKNGTKVWYSATPPGRDPQKRESERIHNPVGVDGPAAPLAMVLPELGAEVTITALVMNEDGSYSIGLRNGKASWLTRLTSHT